MSYLIDSDVIIDFLNGENQPIVLLQELKNKDLFISVITWIEVVYGTKRSLHPKTRKKNFEDFLSLFKIKLISINLAISEEFIAVKVALERRGIRLPDFDLLIAAAANVNDLVLVTRNIRHFSRIKTVKIYKNE